MLRAILVDDEIQSINALSLKLKTIAPEVVIAGSTTDPLKVMELIQATPELDLLFLDVEMPGLNGLALLDLLRNRSFEVIMVTAYSEYALQALKASAIDYLLKPVDNEELRIAVDKVIAKKSAKDQNAEINQKIDALSSLLKLNDTGNFGKIILHSAKEVQFISPEQIVRIQGDNNYSHFYLSNGTKITVTKTLKDFESSLDERHFFRIHKSHIINEAFLKKLNKGFDYSVEMTDGSVIEVSVRRKANFLKWMEQIP